MTLDTAIQDAVADLVSQPELFSAAEAPAVAFLAADAPLIAAARTTRRPVTGQRVTKNEARCLVIAAMKCAGFPDSKIEQAVNCDRRSIPRIMESLEAAGVVPAIKDRMGRKVAYLAEATADLLQEYVSDGRLSKDGALAVKSLSVNLGITVEKALLLMGQATQIRANVGAESVLTDAELSAWLRPSPDCRTAPPPDSESGVPALNCPIIEASVALHTTPPTTEADDRPDPHDGGEGVANGGGSKTDVGSGTSRNFGHGDEPSTI